jgi:hypothetical protein
MSSRYQFRDLFRSYTPKWLMDRWVDKRTAGYRVLWSMIAALDVLAEVLFQGVYSWFPGLGTATALPLIGRSRGIVRGQADTIAEYAAKLRGWLSRWRLAGTAEGIARTLHEYLGNHPRVRVVTRSSYWVTINQDGSITRKQGTIGNGVWNWDGVSHPERAGFWSEIWIIIYPTQWAHRGNYGDPGQTWGGDVFGFGHGNDRIEYDAVKALISTWKSAHTRVRAVVWTSDNTLFDPDTQASLPAGDWGAWGTTGGGARVASGRNQTTCRYWEP